MFCKNSINELQKKTTPETLSDSTLKEDSGIIKYEDKTKSQDQKYYTWQEILDIL